MKYTSIIYSGHAIRRMFERKVSKEDVLEILKTEKIIEEYPDDTPFPSFLITGVLCERPLHIVAAYNKDENACYVITVYEPDPDLWNKNFTERSKL